MTQTWLTHDYHDIFLRGTVNPYYIYQIDIRDHYMTPYVKIYTYFTHIYIYFTVGGSFAIYRIVIDDLYIVYDPPNAIYGFMTSLCPYESFGTRMATLMSPSKLIHLYTREFVRRDGDLVVLRSLLPTRRDTDNQVFEVTSHLPGPIVSIWVIQTHIDTIGPIHNPWFHRSHVLKWVPYELIFAHRPMAGVYNIVSLDYDIIARAGYSLTWLLPTRTNKNSWLWQSYRMPG